MRLSVNASNKTKPTCLHVGMLDCLAGGVPGIENGAQNRDGGFLNGSEGCSESSFVAGVELDIIVAGGGIKIVFSCARGWPTTSWASLPVRIRPGSSRGS